MGTFFSTKNSVFFKTCLKTYNFDIFIPKNKHLNLKNEIS